MAKNTLKYGLILGLCQVVASALMYAGGIKIFANWWLAILVLLLVMVTWIILAVRMRRENGDVFTFGQAFITLAVSAGVCMAVAQVWGLVLFNVIDKELPVKMTEKIMEQTASFMDSMGAPQAQIDQTMEEMAVNMKPEKFGVGGQLLQFVWNTITMCIISLIVAAIIKRKQPPVPAAV